MQYCYNMFFENTSLQNLSRSSLSRTLQRNGADFSVFINTAQAFDGSDSGATPDEAVSWGKIRKDATPVKVSFMS